MRAPNWLPSPPSAVRTLLDGRCGVGVTPRSASAWFSSLFLPSPAHLPAEPGAVDLLETGYNGTSLLQDIGISLVRVLAGFGTGAVIGTMVGLAMGSWRGFDVAVEPYIEFLRPLPQLGYLVLLIIWFGIGETSKIVLLFLTALPVAAVAARDGVLSVPVQRIQVARMLGTNPRQIFLPGCFAERAAGDLHRHAASDRPRLRDADRGRDPRRQ